MAYHALVICINTDPIRQSYFHFYSFAFKECAKPPAAQAAQIFLLLLHPSGRDLLEESRHISQLLLEFRLQRYEHTIHVIYHRFS